MILKLFIAFLLGFILGMVFMNWIDTDIKIYGKIKQKAKREGTNLIEDISTTINTKKSLRRDKKDKKRKLFNRKNKK